MFRVAVLSLVLLSAMLPTSSYANIIEQVFTNTWQTTDYAAGWSYQNYYLFDNSLGTLNNVDISIGISLSGITSSDTIKVRSNFYGADYWFYNQEFFVEGDYSRNWSIDSNTITGWVPGENTYIQDLQHWTTNTHDMAAFYQDSDGPAHSFSSTTKLVYDYTPVATPEPSTLLLLSTGLGGLALLRRKARK